MFVISVYLFKVNPLKTTVLIPIISLISYLVIFNYLLDNFLGYDILSEIQDFIYDYVLILDNQGQVIFDSISYRKSSFFKNKQHFDVDDIASFFNHPIMLSERFHTKYIKVLSENVHYFRYSCKEIINKNICEGYIYTFVDVTELLEKLIYLETQKNEVSKTNAVLSRYKDKVYFIQRQKEITSLLEQIAENQIKSIYEIEKDLQELDLNSSGARDKLEVILSKSKLALAEVRSTVSTYKQ